VHGFCERLYQSRATPSCSNQHVHFPTNLRKDNLLEHQDFIRCLL
jgi:hypothetical protein